MLVVLVIVSGVSAVLWAAALRQLALRRGEDPVLYALLGLLLGPVALVLLIGDGPAPVRRRVPARRSRE